MASASAAGLPVGNAPRTLEAWFRTTNRGAMQILRYGVGPMVTLELRDDNAIRFYSSNGQFGSFYAPYDLRDGAWHLVDASYDGTKVVVSVDGVEIGDVELVLNTQLNGVGLRIGDQFDGDIDEVAIYGRALTPAEANEHRTIAG